MAEGRERPRASRWAEIAELTRVRVRLFLREPEAMFWVFVFPVLLTVVLGFAFRSQELPASRVAVLDAPALAKTLQGKGLEVVNSRDLAAARRELRKGTIDALVMPGTPPTIRFNPARPEAALARERVLRRLSPTPRLREVAKDQPAQERGSRYIDFLFAGILGMNLMGTGIWGVGFAIADLRQKKLLKRMMVTPMRRSSLLMSFVLSRMIFLVLEVVALLLFGVFVLDVPVLGSVAVVCLLGTFAGFAFAGMGLLAASRAQTIEGASGLMNLVIMPMWLASGVFFSYERFPEFLHLPIRLLPLTAINDALRRVMLDGLGLGACLFELAVLAVWAVLAFAVALKIFRWQ